ncbi:MAG: hypothetical protein N3A64_05310, partial [Desulfobacterota bacterium]|nr:hypothetical protein [Thermodesulfobacteriota bacterium]
SDTEIDRFYFDDSLVIFFKAGDSDDLAEKIITLYYNPSFRQELAINSLKFIQQNNWQVKEKLYFEIINSMFGSKLLPKSNIFFE